MAGIGATPVLDKGFLVSSAYSGGTVNIYRLVKLTATGSVDLNVASNTRSIGVIQEDVDSGKVTTGKVVENVRILGVTRVKVSDTGTVPVLGDRVISGTDGGVILAAGAGNFPIGVVVGAPAGVSAGDIVQVLLTPGLPPL